MKIYLLKQDKKKLGHGYCGWMMIVRAENKEEMIKKVIEECDEEREVIISDENLKTIHDLTNEEECQYPWEKLYIYKIFDKPEDIDIEWDFYSE